MSIYITLNLQPDNDFIITGQQTSIPSVPYIVDDNDTALEIIAFIVLGIHLRNLPAYEQNHLANSPGHLRWDISGMSPYHSLL